MSRKTTNTTKEEKRIAVLFKILDKQLAEFERTCDRIMCTIDKAVGKGPVKHA